ncbi:amidohydrolase [Microaceticoccus formicicus]|uniref:amidohydrolase n=1 Tax=Microaceticoccus formicicus TaxID=3118105 RepID=UPI003CD042CF|nr:amidohydrolase [Peptoniphilaceae bacterium AMB_02]
MNLLIKNIDVIPMTEKNLILENVDIHIVDNRISYIGVEKDGFTADKIIDGKGKIAIPGLINAHTHLGMSLMRNYADDLDLMTWLQDEIWPFEAKLGREDIYYASKLSMIELIKSGCTAFVDMYFEMDRVADAALEIGIRGVVTPGYIEDDKSEDRIRNYRNIYEKYNDKDGLIKVMIAPHSPYTVGKEHLLKLIKLAKELNTGIHIHLSETKMEVENAMRDFGKSPIAYVEELGLFEVHTIAAHCVHVDENDMRILAENNVFVVHNPSSNLKLASGFAKVDKMMELGVKVALGTDGASSNNNLNMMEEMHIASLLGKAVSNDPKALDAYQTLEMATINGAKSFGMGDELGSLENGKLADIAIIDMNKTHLVPANNKISMIVYAAQASDVDTVIINGRVVMENGELIGVDEASIVDEVNKRLRALKETK